MKFGQKVVPFLSHTSRSLFSGLPLFLPPAGLQVCIIAGKFLRSILKSKPTLHIRACK